MTAYNATDPNDFAYSLARHSFVSVLADDLTRDHAVARLQADGYKVVFSDASTWIGGGDLSIDLDAALGTTTWPGPQGIDEFFDFWPLDERDAWTSEYTGLVIMLENYDEFTRADARLADMYLDILSEGCREAALIGIRILVLLTARDTGLWDGSYNSTRVARHRFNPKVAEH